MSCIWWGRFFLDKKERKDYFWAKSIFSLDNLKKTIILMFGYTEDDQLKLEGAIKEIVKTLKYPLPPELTGTLELSFPFQRGRINGTVWVATKGRYHKRKLD